MTIENNKVVQLMYELRIGNASGEFVEKTDSDSPLTFIFGLGQMLPHFEQNIQGLKVGDTFAFGIESDNAYGPKFDDAIVDIPSSTFAGHESLLAIGNQVPMRGEDGHLVRGTIIKLSPSTVTMDFNHPMAGQDLYFTGSVVSLRDASAEELDHGHVHGDGGVHH